VLISELPASRSDRWKLLDAFLERWFTAPRGHQGVGASELRLAEQRLGLSLPAAFREWYERYAARENVWSLQDTLRTPHQLNVEHGALVFCVENQSVVQWGIQLEELTREDPPVVVSDPAGGTTWLVESPSTSAFAATFAVMNVKWSEAVRYRANGAGTAEAFVAIEERYSRLPFQDLNWPAWPTRFYGSDDLVLETHADSWIWASARSRSALAELDAIVRAAGMDAWEAYEVD
jgi:hypothetical protein